MKSKPLFLQFHLSTHLLFLHIVIRVVKKDTFPWTVWTTTSYLLTPTRNVVTIVVVMATISIHVHNYLHHLLHHLTCISNLLLSVARVGKPGIVPLIVRIDFTISTNWTPLQIHVPFVA